MLRHVLTMALVCASLLTACAGRQARPDKPDLDPLVTSIRNSDITWHVQSLRTVPVIKEGSASANVLKRGESSIPALVACLDDPDRFVAAHVLLLDLKRIKTWYFATSHYFGLYVELSSTGVWAFGSESRGRLKQCWSKWLLEERLAATQPARQGDDKSELDQLISGIRNSDITWDYQADMLLPHIREGSTSEKLVDGGDSTVRALVECLDDPERFVAAHVLLTRLKPTMTYRFNRQFYFGLHIELDAQGHWSYPSNDLGRLKQCWTKCLQY